MSALIFSYIRRQLWKDGEINKRKLGWLLLPLLLLLSTNSLACSKKDSETKCLACNIYHEARDQNIQGQIAVALVTKYRVNSNKYPNNYCKVVWQPNQFSWTNDKLSDKPKNNLLEKRAWLRSVNLAKIILQSEGYIELTHLTSKTLWYHRDDVSPSWAKRFNRIAKIERHIFYEHD